MSPALFAPSGRLVLLLLTAAADSQSNSWSCWNNVPMQLCRLMHAGLRVMMPAEYSHPGLNQGGAKHAPDVMCYKPLFASSAEQSL